VNLNVDLLAGRAQCFEQRWIKTPGRRFGGVSGDATARPVKVWSGGKGPRKAVRNPDQGAQGQVGYRKAFALVHAAEITQVSATT